MARVRYTDNTPRVRSEVAVKSNIALRLMVGAVIDFSTPKTPKREGDLRLNVRKTVLGSKAQIEWRQPYSRKQEETQFKNYTTPGTGPHFAENAVRKVASQAEKYFRQAGMR